MENGLSEMKSESDTFQKQREMLDVAFMSETWQSRTSI